MCAPVRILRAWVCVANPPDPPLSPPRLNFADHHRPRDGRLQGVCFCDVHRRARRKRCPKNWHRKVSYARRMSLVSKCTPAPLQPPPLPPPPPSKIDVVSGLPLQGPGWRSHPNQHCKGPAEGRVRRPWAWQVRNPTAHCFALPGLKGIGVEPGRTAEPCERCRSAGIYTLSEP